MLRQLTGASRQYLRQTVKLLTPSLSQTCNTSTWNTKNLVIEEDDDVAVIKMGRKPVNSLNLDLLTELNETMIKVQKNEDIQGLILTSSLPRMFSAGLDIMEFVNPTEDRLKQFWTSLQNLWMQLYGSRLVTMAAINGHSPAGGCLLATSCDYRIMAQGKYSIGLNETKLGIVAPFWFCDTFIDVIGTRQGQMALQLGTLFSPDQALQIGLVDQVIEESKVMQATQDEMQKWLTIPSAARSLSKSLLRQKTVQRLLDNREEDINNFVKIITHPRTQQGLQFYMERLKAK